ncbi:MAG: hypothetical protein HHAS10_02350 [Candidatus Altimarinota bacterium]
MNNNTPRAFATHGIHEKSIEIIKGVLESKESPKILIASAGSGNFEKQLVETLSVNPKDITPLDINGDTYSYDLTKPNFVLADLNNPLPFDDEAFDLIICIETIEHISYTWQLLREFSRVTKVGGNVFITSPNCESFAARLFFLVKGILPAFQQVDFDKSGHITPFFSWVLKYFLEALPLQIVSYDSHSFHAWIIPYVWKVRVPMKSILFAETNMWLLKKKEA